MSGVGVKRIGQYVIGDTIGKGSFGKVKMAEHAITKHLVAIKIINREKVRKLDMVGRIKKEIQILKLFRHPHIIKLYQVVSSPSDVFLVMEHVSGGELFDYIKTKGKLSEDESRRFFQQIISGVLYCHKHMVVHRDLKPENLLLDRHNNVKIADFGLSNIMTDGNFLKTSCGSPNYAAPEVISGKLYAGPEVDVWSCGVILYVLLSGRLPFDDANVSRLFTKILRGAYEMDPHIPPAAQSLIEAMLVVDPVKRIDMAGIIAHPWFQKNVPGDLFVEDEKGCSFDVDIIEEICKKFQVYKDNVVEALQKGSDTDQLVIAYKLISNNKRQKAKGADDELDLPIGRDQKPKSKAPVKRQITSELILPAAMAGNPKRFVKRSRWHLGMRSKNRPGDVMVEVFRTLRSLNFEWKVITPYHIRCRCWNQVSGNMVKMSLKLYRADRQHYLLDFQNLSSTYADSLQPFDENAPASLTSSSTNGLDTGSSHGSTSSTSDSKNHELFYTMEFFELCTLVIKELGA